jgi:mono/diheme cytochrome c family protein
VSKGENIHAGYMSLRVKGTILGFASASAVLGAVFGFPQLLHQKTTVESKREQTAAAMLDTATVPPATEAKKGYALFDHNCAPCHGEDARGDEGPSLYNLTRSDARLKAIIKGGVKGEMPAFARKFTDADVQALLAYLRTLKE